MCTASGYFLLKVMTWLIGSPKIETAWPCECTTWPEPNPLKMREPSRPSMLRQELGTTRSQWMRRTRIGWNFVQMLRRWCTAWRMMTPSWTTFLSEPVAAKQEDWISPRTICACTPTGLRTCTMMSGTTTLASTAFAMLVISSRPISSTPPSPTSLTMTWSWTLMLASLSARSSSTRCRTSWITWITTTPNSSAWIAWFEIAAEVWVLVEQMAHGWFVTLLEIWCGRKRGGASVTWRASARVRSMSNAEHSMRAARWKTLPVVFSKSFEAGDPNSSIAVCPSAWPRILWITWLPCSDGLREVWCCPCRPSSAATKAGNADERPQLSNAFFSHASHCVAIFQTITVWTQCEHIWTSFCSWWFRRRVLQMRVRLVFWTNSFHECNHIWIKRSDCLNIANLNVQHSLARISPWCSMGVAWSLLSSHLIYPGLACEFLWFPHMNFTGWVAQHGSTSRTIWQFGCPILSTAESSSSRVNHQFCRRILPEIVEGKVCSKHWYLGEFVRKIHCFP